MKSCARLLAPLVLALAGASDAQQPMVHGPLGDAARDVIVAPEPPPPPPKNSGYVCELQMIGGTPAAPFGGMQVFLGSTPECSGDTYGFAAWMVDTPLRPSEGAHAAYSEAHVLAMQRDLLLAAREGWRVVIDHKPESAVIQRVTLLMR